MLRPAVLGLALLALAVLGTRAGATSTRPAHGNAARQSPAFGVADRAAAHPGTGRSISPELVADPRAALQPPALQRRSTAGRVPVQDVEVFAGHPRLLVGGYRGVSLDALRAACADPQMRGECDQLGSGYLDEALDYLLTGDAEKARSVRSWLLAGVYCSAGKEETGAGGYALAYDWIAPTITLPGQKERIESALAACGLALADALRKDKTALWRDYQPQAGALAMIALALDDAPEKEELLADARELFRENALQAWQVVGGAWPEGYDFERRHFFAGSGQDQYVLAAVLAWNSAVRRDHPDHMSILETIAAEEGDWLRAVAYHILYGTLEPYGNDGKLTLLRGGDMSTGQIYPRATFRPFVDAIARAYADGALKHWGERLETDWPFVGDSGTYHGSFRYLLPVTLPVDVASATFDALPLARIWGRDSVGDVLARSGWDADAAVIGYRAGAWFTDHQHSDQGHIDLWRDGPLAVDSGVFATPSSVHYEAYYIRTVAHNSILVHEDGETFQQYPGLAEQVNDGGQRMLKYTSCPGCLHSVDAWRSNVGAGAHFEGGSIAWYDASPTYLSVGSDLTGAYNSTRFTTDGNTAKVSSVERDLLYLRPDLLLVADRVVPDGDPGPDPPAFVLHFPVKPALDGLAVIQGSEDDGILATTAPTFTLDNGTGGALFGQALVPNDRRVRVIGGPRYRFWVDGENRGSGAVFEEDPPAEPGAWRIEIAPSERQPSYLLLNALTITTTVGAPISTTLMSVTQDAAGAGAIGVRATGRAGATLALLPAAVPRAAWEYAAFDVDTGDNIVATGLQPDADYRLMAEGRAPTRFRSNVEGGLTVTSPPAGRVAIGHCPAPDAAGDSWQALCREPTPTPTPTPTATPTPPAPEKSYAYLPSARVEDDGVAP